MLCTLITKMASVKKNSPQDRVYDEMIEFLGEPVFQIPIRSFMDENCLIFDVDSEPLKEHRDVFAQYKQLVDDLLGAFCEDVNLTPEQAVLGIRRLNRISDLHDMFSGLFEQVLAANDFNIFYTAMARHNILVQEQVIAMLLATTGMVPLSLLRGVPHSAQKMDAHAKNRSDAPATMDRHEEQLMNMVLQNSRSREALVDGKDSKKMLDAKALEMSQQEAKSLQMERKNIEEQMKRLVIEGEGASPPKPGRDDKGPAGNRDAPQETPLSSKEAAENWIRSAKTEIADESSSHSAYAASLSKLSPEEIKLRQEFLRQQRDKLLAMKKEAREKQLKDAERLQSARPMSARAARSAMSQKPVVAAPSTNPEDDKKLAMRRAIAEKLRQEVIRQ